MPGFLHDLRASCRHLIRRPLHACAWAGTLALTLAAASAIYGLVDAVLLRPLPFPEEERLVRLHTAFPESGLTELSLSPGEFVDVQEGTDAFEALGAFIPASYTLTQEGQATRVAGAWATPGLFRALGVPPIRGRAFSPEERASGAPRLAILSHGFWHRQFGGDPDVVGRTITLDGRAVTVVGVMPAGSAYPTDAEIWTSLRFSEGMVAATERGSRYLRVVGRLAPGIEQAALERRLAPLMAAFRRKHPRYYEDSGFRLTAVGLREQLVGDVRGPLFALLAGVALVLLVAVANLANLSLVRTTERSRGMAVRATLGASRARLVRQAVLENLLLACVAAVAGLALGSRGVRWLANLAPEGIPRLDAVGADPRVLGLGLAVALAAGLAAGVVPALLGSGRRLGDTLRPGHTRVGEPREGRRIRDVLVAGQVAVTLVLLVGAGLVIRSLDGLGRVDPGVDPTNTLTARVALPSSTYPEPADVRAFYDRLLGGLRELPGVRSAGATAILPLDDGGWEVSFEVEGRPRPEDAPEPAVQYRPVTPGFFETLQVPVVAGRRLVESDRLEAPLVAVVNRAFARRHLSGVEAPGARIRLPILGLPMEEHVRTVVGVVGDVRESLTEEAVPTLYVPHAQQPERGLSLVLRADGPAAPLTGAVRARLRELDPGLPLYEVRTMERVVEAGLARHRFVSFLLGLFSGTGLVLACLGVWGVVTYAVTRRTRELGIRLALGSTPRAVIARVGGRAVLPVVLGAGVGIGGALLTTRFLASLLFGLGSRDPATFVGATAVVLLVGGASAWLPVRRAAALDPMTVLREE